MIPGSIHRRGFVLLVLLWVPLFSTVVKIQSITGAVTVLEIGDDGRETPRGNAQPGRLVADSQTIVTSSGATAVLVYDDGTEITLKPGSRLTIGAQEESKGFLSLLSGSLLAKVKKLSASDNFSVVTPSAIAGVRGTTFAVTVGDSGETHVGVEEGNVQVDDPDTEGKPSTSVSGGEASESGLGGKTLKKSGFKMESFNHETWLANQGSRINDRLPEIMDGIESRFKSAAEAMIKSQAAFVGNMEQLKKLSEKMKTAKAQGREIPENATAMHQALTQKIMVDVARLKMVGHRMQAFTPVLEKLKSEGRLNPKIAAQMNAFVQRTAELRGKITENRRKFSMDMEKQKDFMRQELKDARERAGIRDLGTPNGPGDRKASSTPTRDGDGKERQGSDRDRQNTRPGNGDRPDGPSGGKSPGPGRK